MTAVDGVTRLYAPTGRVAHLVRDYHSVVSPNTRVALCGAWGWPWHGTGNQDEYEKAEKLPTCKRCREKLVAA